MDQWQHGRLQFDPGLNKHFPFVYTIWPTIKHGQHSTTLQFVMMMMITKLIIMRRKVDFNCVEIEFLASCKKAGRLQLEQCTTWHKLCACVCVTRSRSRTCVYHMATWSPLLFSQFQGPGYMISVLYDGQICTVQHY